MLKGSSTCRYNAAKLSKIKASLLFFFIIDDLLLLIIILKIIKNYFINYNLNVIDFIIIFSFHSNHVLSMLSLLALLVAVIVHYPF